MSKTNDRLGEHPPSSARARRKSLGTRLLLGTALLVACVTGVGVTELSQREWQRLLESKRTAADMVANLFAGTMAPALVRGDVDAVKAGLSALRSNEMIVYAAVFSGDGSTPLAEHHHGRGDGDARDAGRAEGEIQVQSGIHGPTGARLGRVVVRVSLAQEAHAFRRSRAGLIGFGAVFALALAGPLLVILRRVLIAPLARLESAALRLSAGERVPVPAHGDDELGSISRSFNSMAAQLEERDRRITILHRRLQALLDDAGQAIVTFGADRLLTEECSRSADRWLDARPGNSIVDILYPEDDSLDVERQAFDAWLDGAFAAPADELRQLLERAPRELVRHTGSRTLCFELAFHLAEAGAASRQLMLLATDVSEQRRLEHRALEKERQHERELSAMRRLAAGSGQLLGGFFDMARRRLVTCRKLIAPAPARVRHASVADRAQIEGLFRQLQTVGEEARRFDLAELEGEVAAIERDIDRIRRDGYELREGDHGNLLLGLENVARRIDEAERAFVQQSPLGAAALDQISVRRSRLVALAAATGSAHHRVAPLVDELMARPVAESFTLLPEAFARWTERAGKKARLCLDPAQAEIPFALSRTLGGVLAHLLHDAIAHGIEPEAERLERGKPAVGLVRVWAVPDPGGTIVFVEDDGRGRPREGLGGPGAAEHAGPERELEPGLPARSSAAPVHGEPTGVGLSAVQSELHAVGYHLALSSTSARGTSLTISPLPRLERRAREGQVGS